MFVRFWVSVTDTVYAHIRSSSREELIKELKHGLGISNLIEIDDLAIGNVLFTEIKSPFNIIDDGKVLDSPSLGGQIGSKGPYWSSTPDTNSIIFSNLTQFISMPCRIKYIRKTYSLGITEFLLGGQFE